MHRFMGGGSRRKSLDQRAGRPDDFIVPSGRAKIARVERRGLGLN
jgi:hypothetical protein